MKKSVTHSALRKAIRLKNRFITLSVFSAMVLGLVFCKTTQGSLQQEQASVVGVESRVVPVSSQSVVVGDPDKNTAVATILGSSMGGDPGLFVSRQMDVVAQALGKKNLNGARIMRLGEGIKVTFDGTILFPKNSDSISVASRETLQHVAEILNEYADSNIVIEGHTDGTGTPAANLDLSEKRTKSVASFLSENRVSSDRIRVIGYGESQPLFSNSTASGKKQNRRVELIIIANDQLKTKARSAKSVAN